MGYGSHAVVLGPVTLGDEIMKAIQAMRAVYGGSNDE
jgi:hypothetical protein